MTAVLGVAVRHTFDRWPPPEMAVFFQCSFGTGSARRRQLPGSTMKPTTLLERQHRNLQQLCETVEGGSASVRASLLPQLAGDLVAHMAVESQVFYPAASVALHEDWMPSSEVRHTRTMKLLERVLDAPVDGEEFARAMGELRGLVERHTEEEEKSLFPRIEHALDSAEMRILARSMMLLYHSEVETGYRRHSETSPVAPIGHAPLP